MPTPNWAKGYAVNTVSSGANAFVVLEAASYLVLPWTVRRVIINWDLALLNTSTDFPLSSQLPMAIGVGITTVAGVGTPAAPADGPLTNITEYTWWNDGAFVRPVYVPAAGNSWWGCGGKIDFTINHKLDPTESTGIWFGAEVDDSTPFFSAWGLSMYSQVLTYPTV